MPIDTMTLLKQFETIDRVYAENTEQSGGIFTEQAYAQYESMCFALVDRLTGPSSPYRDQARAAVDPKPNDRYIGVLPTPQAWRLHGVLEGLKADITDGHMRSLVEIVHADVFSDFLEMAEYLLEQGYKDPAAVIAGSVLEQCLRDLCDLHNVSVRVIGANGSSRAKSAEAMNTELRSAGAYGKNEQKQVTAWYGHRNSAAHGEYDAYTKEDIAVMLAGIRVFVAQNPA